MFLQFECPAGPLISPGSLTNQKDPNMRELRLLCDADIFPFCFTILRNNNWRTRRLLDKIRGVGDGMKRRCPSGVLTPQLKGWTISLMIGGEDWYW